MVRSSSPSNGRPVPPQVTNPNFNTHPQGGLSRSSGSGSLALLAGPASCPSPSAYDSPCLSPWGGSSRTNSPTPPSTAPSSQAYASGSGPPSSSNNTGFVVMSRPKSYLPPSAPLPSSPSSLPSSSPPAPPSPILNPTRPLHSSSLSHNPSNSSSLRSRRSSPPAPFRLQPPGAAGGSPPLPSAPLSSASEPKTTLTLSSSIDSQGRRMVNQYVRLKTIGQGSHGKVWLCAEPTLRETDEEEEEEREEKRRGKEVTSQWEEEVETGDVKYCAIKSVAREGVGRGKSLKAAKGRKAGGISTGIGADDKVKREVAIMKRLDHKNVVRLKEVIDDVKSKKVFMVLEFMAGGQIVWQDELKRPTMTVDEARRTFRDVVLGLEYLHYQGIIHRDIKPANLLWTEDHSTVKISDFGVSHVSDALLRASPGGTDGEDDKALRKTAGSPAFFAPELCHPAEFSTPTPQPHDDDLESYFSTGARGFASPSTASTPNGSTPTTPNGLTLSSVIISPPLPALDASKPRPRPIIGKGIDVWALGVTLFCLLFGDTPFMARTEYELYNVIVREGVRVPERMGREGAWTGVGRGWEGCGDGVEGREVVDLLSKLLEKDPLKRIGLAEVKKHPWVLRNLSSPESWLCDTDPAQSAAVRITDEDVEHATQERGAVDALPRIRNRLGIRRALNAALVRFPAFSRMKGSRRQAGVGGSPRSRSKSASSTSQSYVDGTSEPPSRHPSDGASGSRGKNSSEFGHDMRKVISAYEGSVSRTSSPASGGGRGGWGARVPQTGAKRSTQSQEGRELSRSVSASSIGNGRPTIPQHLFPTRKNSDPATSRSNASASPSPSVRTASPAWPSSDTESTGRRTLSKMLSRLGGRARTPKPAEGKGATGSDDDSIASIVEPSPVDERHDDRHATFADEPLEYNSRRASLPTIQGEVADVDDFDTSDFEYSSGDEGEDDFESPPLGQADGISGWQSGFTNFGVGVRDVDDYEVHEGDRDPDKTPPTFKLDDATPRASAHVALVHGIDLDPSATPPPLVRQYSDSPSRKTARDGSIRAGVEGGQQPASLRRWSSVTDEEEEDEGTEIFMAFRRRRAATGA